MTARDRDKLRSGPGSGDRLCQPRRGITIIEVIVVMTGVAALLGLSVVLLQLLMKLDGEARGQFQGAVALERLAHQFRQDVHGSTAARLEKPAGANTEDLRLEPGPDRSVEYQPRGEAILRIETQKGKVVRRETYSIPRSTGARFELRDEAGSRFVTLAVPRVVTKGSIDPPRTWEILAQVGKDRASLSTSTKAKAKAKGDKP
jgi:hypothetical protein